MARLDQRISNLRRLGEPDGSFHPGERNTTSGHRHVTDDTRVPLGCEPLPERAVDVLALALARMLAEADAVAFTRRDKRPDPPPMHSPTRGRMRGRHRAGRD